MRVFILGSGKVGRGLAKGLRKAGWPVQVRAARSGLPTAPIHASLLILAVRDAAMPQLTADLVRHRLVRRETACVHVAGARGPEMLDALRSVSAGVAQMHPMISFADAEAPPSLLRGNLHVSGDPVAVRRARAVARALGMTARTIERLDRVGYHAAAGLVANGAAALAAMGATLLERSGVATHDAPRLLGPLLRSVADNVERLGFPAALTGPVRRGDAAAIEKQLGLLRERMPEAIPLFVAACAAQIPLARALPDASSRALDEIEARLSASSGSVSLKQE
jgi:predicted short-subunit dehydrogenase-like oxidoreductase (DUF2520 family)